MLLIIDPIRAAFAIDISPTFIDHTPIIISGIFPMVAAINPPFFSPIVLERSDVIFPSLIANGIMAKENIIIFKI
ncbi:hypothetical protein D3C76_1268330 [compost metagenome]